MNSDLPGGDLIEAGIRDLRNGGETIPALSVAIGAPRLRNLGIEVPANLPKSPEHRLYNLLAKNDSDSAHSRYNAYLRRLVSYERAAECEPVTAEHLQAFMRALGVVARTPSRIYLAGGASTVLLGSRPSTIDIKFKLFLKVTRYLEACRSSKKSFI